MEKVARIYYNWWGNANFKNRLWCLLDCNGEVIDYGRKKQLIAIAEKQGLKYQVERHHKKERGKMTILEKNF